MGLRCLCLCIIVWYRRLSLGCLDGGLVIGDCGDIVGFVFGWFVGFGLVACFRMFWFAALLIVLFLFVVLICVLIVVMSVF